MESFIVRRSGGAVRLDAGVVLAVVLVAHNAGGQLVTPRTIPVKQSEQFQIFPTSLPGSGGVSIAVDDTLGDLFVNPAMATRLRRAVAFGAPYVHGISDDQGGGRTLPGGVALSRGRWSGAVFGAMQEINRKGPVAARSTSDRTATNSYLSSTLARRIGNSLSVGAAAYHADIEAVDGVDLLYAGSDRIDQGGSVTDLRVGAVREWKGGRVGELLLLHNRTAMSHRVHYAQTWNATRRTFEPPAREEINDDRTHIWGAHASYVQPVGDSGWRVGGVATANRLDHPKIPNYTLVSNIPRDPGTTYSFNFGLGASQTIGRSVLALDFVLEPMMSHTWALAENDTARANTGVIRAGEKTVKNDFLFRNKKLRFAFGRTAAPPDSGVSFGYLFSLGMYSIDYRLVQDNYVQGTHRLQYERWKEWTPSFGLQWRSRAATIGYTFAVTCGAGAGCVPLASGDKIEVVSPVTPGGIITAPTQSIRFESGTEWSHRFSIVVPLR
jgi:hypothetical protein